MRREVPESRDKMDASMEGVFCFGVVCLHAFALVFMGSVSYSNECASGRLILLSLEVRRVSRMPKLTVLTG